MACHRLLCDLLPVDEKQRFLYTHFPKRKGGGDRLSGCRGAAKESFLCAAPAQLHEIGEEGRLHLIGLECILVKIYDCGLHSVPALPLDDPVPNPLQVISPGNFLPRMRMFG